jgi:hypothetical protein
MLYKQQNAQLTLARQTIWSPERSSMTSAILLAWTNLIASADAWGLAA